MSGLETVGNSDRWELDKWAVGTSYPTESDRVSPKSHARSVLIRLLGLQKIVVCLESELLCSSKSPCWDISVDIVLNAPTSASFQARPLAVATRKVRHHTQPNSRNWTHIVRSYAVNIG